MACRGCKNFFLSWGLLFDDELGDQRVPTFPDDTKKKGWVKAVEEEKEKDEVVEATVERRGAQLITHHRHRSECTHSEGNRFITDNQL